MATWSESIFTTTDTIKRYESNVNELAPTSEDTGTGKYYSVQVNAVWDFRFAIFEDFPAVFSFTTDNYDVILVDARQLSEITYTWQQNYNIIGSGLIYGKSGQYAHYTVGNVLNSDTTFVEDSNISFITMTGTTLVDSGKVTAGNWNDKIALAKEKLYNDLITILISLGYDEDQNPLDNITNPTILNDISDLLTLSLIYRQLVDSGLYETFKTKANTYQNQYKTNLISVAKRLKIDNVKLATWSSGRLQV